MSAHPAVGNGRDTVIDLSAQRSMDAVSSVTARVHEAGAWTVVEVDGEMDLQVVALIGDAMGGGTSRVVFDLHAVTFMDANGLGLLLGWRRRALVVGGTVRLVAPSRSVRRLLMLTGCARTFESFDSLDEALAAPVEQLPPPAA